MSDNESSRVTWALIVLMICAALTTCGVAWGPPGSQQAAAKSEPPAQTASAPAKPLG